MKFMKFNMFKNHPYMEQVMALYNVDTNMRECQRRLEGSEPLTRGKLNITAIDIGRTYVCLFNYIYDVKGEKTPEDMGVYEILESLLSEEDVLVKSELLTQTHIVQAWQETELPLNNINTSLKEVTEVFEKLSLFYRWVESKYAVTEE